MADEAEKQAQANARERYQSYTQGWRDAAATRSVDKNFEEHPTRPDLKKAYLAGYTAGYRARRQAHEDAAAMYDYQPNILRLAAAAENP